MKIGVFYGTCSPNPEKKKYLDAFIESSKHFKGDTFIPVSHNRYVDCDVAIIFGFYGVNMGELHKTRKHIYTQHTNRGKKCIFIDADLFRFLGDKNKDDTHVRISYKSIFFNEAIHFNEKYDDSRWKLIQSRKGINLHDYKTDGTHILVCLNSNPYVGRGWSAGNVDIYDWAEKTISEIRNYSNSPILLRFHPNTKENDQKKIPLDRFIKASKNNINFSGGVNMDNNLIIPNTSLVDDCKISKSCVVHNTSASTTPMIYGIPVFTSDKNCPVYEISNHKLVNIENPKLIQREDWLHKTSFCLWNYKEIKSGIVWSRFRSRLNLRGDFSKVSAAKIKK
jgi:hypothetical protein